jgi:hypothetical protein
VNRRNLLAGPVALALVLAAGCSGDSSSRSDTPPAASTATAGPAQQRVESAAGAWEEFGTASVELSVATGGQSITARGAVDADTGATRLTFELPGTGEVEVLTTRDSVYLKGLPGQPDDSWAQVSAEQAATLGLSLDQADPTETLLLLRGAKDVREAGSETVHGSRAAKLTGTIDVERAASAAGAGPAEGLRGAGVDEVPFTLYLDEQDRPLRLVQTLRFASGGARSTSTITVDMDDWGRPVDVAAPDQADVVPLNLPQPEATGG